MTETLHGTDTVNDTITVKGLTFSSQLGIGSAKWLQKKRGKSLPAIAQELQDMKADNPDLDLMGDLITALHIQSFYQARKPVDLVQAEIDVNGLTLPEMNEVLGRGRPLDFEPKNSPTVEPTEAPSTGPASNTT